MKSKILFLIKTYLFWILLSCLAKGLFLFYQGTQSTVLSSDDIGNIFLKGIRMDFSLGGYILLLFSVFMLLSIWLKLRVMKWIFSFFSLLLLLFFCSVVIVDLELFSNWGYHIDATPLLYLKTPAAAMASTPISLIIALSLLMITSVCGAFYFYKQWVLNKFQYKESSYYEIPLFLLIAGAMIIPIRGGFNVAPMNSSFVFFHSTNMFANQCAVNPVWNFIYEVTHIDKNNGNYTFMDEEEALECVQSLIKSDKSSIRFLSTERPNIVFILLESFTANAIHCMGGKAGITPTIDSLAKEGVLFTNIYATAGRSDRGLVAAISGIPSHPDVAIIKYPNRTIQYPRFPKDLEQQGYNTHFYYAGDINFGSFRSYTTMSFQNIITEDDFSGVAIENRFKWGVHDEYMFDRLFEDITQNNARSFYMAFNMSSHEPFEVPMQPIIAGNDRESKFLNAIHYSDRCLGEFIKKCKSSTIWDSTLFVLMADHGTRHIGNLEPTSPNMYRIPLLFTGGVITKPGLVIDKIGSQTDMIATLFDQLDMDYSQYIFSKNLLSSTPIEEFAFFSYSDAASVVSKDGVLTYNLKSQTFSNEDSSSIVRLKAYLQLINKVTKQ